jgi:hypothetical protein
LRGVRKGGDAMQGEGERKLSIVEMHINTKVERKASKQMAKYE